MIQIQYFDVSEFDSKDAPGSGGSMRLSTLLKLDKARWTFGKKVRVTSGFRTKAYGEDLKRRGFEVAKNSPHYQGWAVDVVPVEGLEADLLKWGVFLDALWAAGFRRFGIMNGSVHVDDDPTKNSPAIWGYKNTNQTVWAMAQNWYAKKIK